MSHFKSGERLYASDVNTIAHQGIQLIGEKTLEVDQPSVVFSGIPQKYASLWMVMSCGTDSTTAAFIVARFNGDTSGSYNTQALQHLGDGTTDNNDYFTGNPWIFLGVVLNNSLSAQNSIIFPGYSRTDRNKSLLSTFSAINATAGDSRVGFCGGEWESSSAVTEIEILERPAGGQDNILAGSIFTLYGLGNNS